MILKQPKTRYLLSPKNGKLFHKLHRILQKKHGSTNTNKTCVYNAKVKGYNVWRRMKLTGPYVISPHVGGSTSYLQSLLKPYLVKEMKDNRNWAHSKMHTNVGTGGEPWDRTHPWQLGIPSSRNVIVSATAKTGCERCRVTWREPQIHCDILGQVFSALRWQIMMPMFT